MNTKSISCVIPMYNDEFTIESTVTKLTSVLGELKADYEIVLVDDGSPDNVGQVADRLASSDSRIKVIHHKTNRGYGLALRSGFDNASKDFVFFTDGDGQYDMEDLKEAWTKLDRYKAVIGYPKQRADGLRRIVVSKVYNTLCRVALGTRAKSINCSFKIINRDFFKNNKLFSKGGFIDAEIVYRLKKDRYEIAEIPVRHLERAHGRSNFLKIGNILNIVSEMARFLIKSR